MSERIRRNLPALQLLHKAKSTKQRKQLVEAFDRDAIEALCEILLNLLYGRIRTNQGIIQKLKRYKKNIRLATLKKTPIGKKRKILQRGGFLGLLAPLLGTVIPAIAQTIGGLFSRH